MIILKFCSENLLAHVQGCFLWFLSFPLLMLVAVIFAEYLRHKVIFFTSCIVFDNVMKLMTIVIIKFC